MKPSVHIRALVMSGACVLLAQPLCAQEQFTLQSPTITDLGVLPADLKCTRDGGDGVSPPLSWVGTPDEAESLVVIMHHYPRDTVPGKDAPSHYWLLWNIPTKTSELSRGNVESIGDEGADKDQIGLGYTPPCSPGGTSHKYTITLYALDTKLTSLGSGDNETVVWLNLMEAMQDKIIVTSEFSFTN